jgi:hypothetical protein
VYVNITVKIALNLASKFIFFNFKIDIILPSTIKNDTPNIIATNRLSIPIVFSNNFTGINNNNTTKKTTNDLKKKSLYLLLYSELSLDLNINKKDEIVAIKSYTTFITNVHVVINDKLKTLTIIKLLYKLLYILSIKY